MFMLPNQVYQFQLFTVLVTTSLAVPKSAAISRWEVLMMVVPSISDFSLR